jgi:formate/nitrite transporter FocA (FNT family)
MIPKRITRTTIGLTIVFFIIGWIFTKPIIDRLIDYYQSLATNSQFVAASMGEQFKIQLCAAIAFGLLPLMCFLTVLLLIKTRKKVISLKDYLVYLVVILGGFIVGGFIRIFLFTGMVKMMNNQDFPNLVNTLPLRLVKFHDWGIIVSLMVCLLIYLFAKK